MSLACPKCQTGDVRSYESIYHSGTQSGSVAGYQHSSSTVLASTVQPPVDRPKIGRVLFVGLLTLFVPVFFASFVPNHILGGWAQAFVGFITFAAGVYLTVQLFRNVRDKDFPSRYAAWKSSFYCMRCSNRFRL